MQQLGYKFDLEEVKKVLEEAKLENCGDRNVIATSEPSSLTSNSNSISNNTA
jgi:hypothetical protein